eukprot:725469-Hanusia_phi.AAC.3
MDGRPPDAQGPGACVAAASSDGEGGGEGESCCRRSPAFAPGSERLLELMRADVAAGQVKVAMGMGLHPRLGQQSQLRQ